MWLWVANHIINDPDFSDANNTMVQNSVNMAPGLLMESTSPIWLYDGNLPGDPDYSCKAGDEPSGCDESSAVIMRECANILVAGAGLCSWFSTYAQDCIGGQTCQMALILWRAAISMFASSI
ncbi:hypothetical protein PspLS_08451 [Pyricularia sp. CBS 133598]|nr:hypothetical protein PspLS_08451 [Pyricularia sp. CBS 133598]